jgi:Asp-tRNA(Asn)/Glu-tRNA(Gln) amidotransferase A subunit family amidase
LPGCASSRTSSLASPRLASPEQYSEFLQGQFAFLGAIGVDDYLASFTAAERLRAQVDAALADAEALLLPANPSLGVRWEDWEEHAFGWYCLCFPFNLSWHPGITIPWALAGNGMPLAFQLVGTLGGGEALLDVAAWCERLTGFDRAPVPA